MFLSVGPLSPNSSTDSLDGAESLSKRSRLEDDSTESTDAFDHTVQVPKDVLGLVFQRLTALKDIVAVCGVCSKWRAVSILPTLLINPIFDRYPSLAILPGASCESKITVDYILKTLVPALDRMARLKILGDAGFTMVTVKQKSATQLHSEGKFNTVAKRAITHEKVSGTWLIANSGLAETGNMTFEEQEKHVKSLGCEMVELVPVMALANHTEDEIGFGDEPLVYVRCKNSFRDRDGKCQVIFGGSGNIRGYSGDVKVESHYAGAMIKI